MSYRLVALAGLALACGSGGRSFVDGATDGDELGEIPAPGGQLQCRRDSDCRLVNDCCTCAAINRRELPAACDPARVCGEATACVEVGGVRQIRCIAGRCVLGLDCDVALVNCRRVRPLCPGGQVPRIVLAGTQRCWGECVEARQCLAVSACRECAEGDQCVGTSAPFHCIPPP